MSAALSLLVSITLSLPDADGLSLAGTVQDAAGKPIAGARVSIATAAPRIGEALFCPSCYRDCAKWTHTDAQGRFHLNGLSPALKFTLMASAPHKRAQQSKLLDPLAGEVTIKLRALPTGNPPERIVQVQVVDDRGQPIVGALADPYGAQTAESRWWGEVKGVDPAESDAEGRLTILLPKGFLAIDLSIAAPGTSGALALLLKPGPMPHTITLPAGTRVTGQLVHEGQPLAGLRVAVVQLERHAGHHFIHAVAATTDPAGKFAIDHLPAGEDYAIFSVLEEGPQKLVISTKRFKASADRQERDLGDLQALPGKHLAGRIELPAGEVLPPNTKIVLDRDPAWDLVAVLVKNDGSFEIEGLPPETYALRVTVKGFKINGSRIPYQLLENKSMGLRVRESIADLRLPLARSTSSDQ